MGIALITKNDAPVEKIPVRISVSKVNEIIDTVNGLTGVSCLKTIRKTIGCPLATTTDYKFKSAANQNEQVIEIEKCIPARSRVVDIYLITDMQFTGAVTLVADIGSASGGAQYIASATIYAASAVLAMANAGAMVIAPSATVGSVFINATPGANWSLLTEGQVSIYITYIDVTDL